MIYVTGFNGQLGRSLIEGFKETIPYGMNKVENMEINTIINCAALTDHNKCNDDPSSAYATNVNLVQNLIADSHIRNAHLIHISTDYVFNSRESNFSASEKTKPNPIDGNMYARTKWLGEEALWCSSFKDWTIVRTSWLMSPFRQAAYLSMDTVWGQFGCPTWAPDLAKALVSLANDPDKPRQKILHYCSKEKTSRGAMASMYQGNNPVLKFLLCPSDRPVVSSMFVSDYWKQEPLTPMEIINEYSKTFPYKK